MAGPTSDDIWARLAKNTGPQDTPAEEDAKESATTASSSTSTQPVSTSQGDPNSPRPSPVPPTATSSSAESESTSTTSTITTVTDKIKNATSRLPPEFSSGGLPLAPIVSPGANGIEDTNTTDPVRSESSSGGLSAGASGGIGAGAAVTVIAVLALIFFMMRRRKKRTRVSSASYDAYVGEGSCIGDLREKGVGVAAIPMNSSSPASAHGDDTFVSPLTRGGTNRSRHAPLNGNSMSRNGAAAIEGDTEPVTRKPVGVGDGEEPLRERQGGRNSVPAQSHVLDEDERARWEEEERILDADIAEAERQGRLV